MAAVSAAPSAATPALFTPLTLRGVTLRNRIVLSPMLTYSSVGGHVNDYHFAHYGKYAQAGVGLVFVESTKVDPLGCSTPRDLGLWKDEFIAPLQRITAFIKSQGAVPGIQISHSGRKARRSAPFEGNQPLADCPGVDHGEPWPLIGPSAIAHSASFETPLAMSEADIRASLGHWEAAARRALQAGFEVLEIHAAHGYLIHQFLSAHANRRTDAYGGSFDNRLRFAREVVAAVRKAWPQDKPLFMRISGTDEAGWTVQDSAQLAAAVKAEGVDVIDCSGGGMAEGPAAAGAVIGYGYQVPYAAHVRREAGIATLAVGLIIHADQANAIIENGQADLVALGRELLLNPNWAVDAAHKLGLRRFDFMPPGPAWYLERRAANAHILPSTWGSGLPG